MLKVAYCDDTHTDRENVSTALTYIQERCDQKFSISGFTSGEELCDSLATNYYDVILLDILMGEMDGLDTATTIRATGQDCVIIFISSYDKKMRELFQFNTTAFIDKPLDKEKLLFEFERILKMKICTPNKLFSFTSERTDKVVNYKKIIAIESGNRQLELTTTEGTYIFHDKLKNVWDILKESKEFVLPTRSIILNLTFAQLDNKTTFTIKGMNREVTIGRIYKEDTLERYLKFVRGSM